MITRVLLLMDCKSTKNLAIRQFVDFVDERSGKAMKAERAGRGMR